MQTLSYFGQPPERRYSAEAGNHPHGSFVDGGQLVIGQNERFDIRARAQGLGFRFTVVGLEGLLRHLPSNISGALRSLMLVL